MARYLHTAIEYDGKFVKNIVSDDGEFEHILSHGGGIRDILSETSSKLLANAIHPSVPKDVDPELFNYIKDTYFRDMFTLSLSEPTEEDIINRTKRNTYHATFHELQVIETRIKEHLDETLKKCIATAKHDSVGQRLSNIERHLGIEQETNDPSDFAEYDEFEYILEDVDDFIWDFRNFSSYTQEILDYVIYNLNIPYPEWSKIRITFFIL